MELLEHKYEVENAVLLLNKFSGATQIYRCEHQSFADQFFILKVCSGYMAEALRKEKEIIDIVQEEYLTDTDYIVPIQDYEDGVIKGKYMAVMATPMARLGDLSNLIDFSIQNTEDFQYRLAIAKEMLTAVHRCHSKSVVHLDIKPQNFFLDYDQVWLGDFGLAQHRENFCLFQASRVFGGTQGYFHPSLLQNHNTPNKTTLVTASMDAWSLGITLFELFFAEKPYENVIPDELDRTEYLEKHGVRNVKLNSHLMRFYDSRIYELLDYLFLGKRTVGQLLDLPIIQEARPLKDLAYWRKRHVFPPQPSWCSLN